MLPSIAGGGGGGGGASHSKHSKEIEDSADDHEAAAPRGDSSPRGGLPSLYPSQSAADDDGSSGTLPPIGFAHGGGSTSGMGGLKIDSKSILGGAQAQKGAMVGKLATKKYPPGGAKKSTQQRQQLGGKLGGGSHAYGGEGGQSSFGLSLSVGNSSHASQPSIEPDGVTGKSAGTKKYQSPYSQNSKK